MRLILVLGIIAVLCPVFYTGSISAQEPVSDDAFFEQLKEDMTLIAEENVQLVEENKALKMELIGLQLEVEQHEEYIDTMSPDRREPREVSRPTRSKEKGWGDPDDALIKEAQNIYISGQWLDTSPAQKLRELHLYDLQYEKQELELDLKLLEFYYEKVKQEQNPKLDQLEQQLKINKARLNELTIKIAEEEKAALAYPQRVDLLEMENAALKNRIRQLKKMLR